MQSSLNNLASVKISPNQDVTEQARLLTLWAADRLDKEGNVAAKDAIGMIKIVIPRMVQEVADRLWYMVEWVFVRTPRYPKFGLMAGLCLADGLMRYICHSSKLTIKQVIDPRKSC